MKRFFNTTGLCNPEKHYIVDPFRGFYDSIYQLIESEQYFLLHAPRQTGKTTFLHQLAHRLNREGKYTCAVVSMESGGYQSITVEAANMVFVQSLYASAKQFVEADAYPPDPALFQPAPDLFQRYLSQWAGEQPKPVVLLIDEVDSLWDDVLVSVLRQLRNGFQYRPNGFPQSIALVGLRDIREYKMKARADNPSLGSGSPFNVKAKSYFLPVFSREEVEGLLKQHTDDTGQAFSEEVVEKLYHFSGGQPWLTNALANEIVREMLGNDFSKKISVDMVEEAKERLIAQRQTHLDSLADKLKESRVRKVVMSIINGENVAFDDFDDAIRYCRDLGIVTGKSPVQFANPIYREIVVRILNAGFQESFNQDLVETAWYLQPGGRLHMDKLLEAFVDFYRWHAESWLERFEYKEAGHQLLLMAFLQRVVNGGGRIEREMAVGNGRTDLAVFWKDQVIPIELKIRHSERSLPDGLRQLSRYMDKLGQRQGYLMLFEKKSSAEIPWEQRIGWEQVEQEGRQITLITL